jgi:tetratricopeptide (TPR) repeat protein
MRCLSIRRLQPSTLDHVLQNKLGIAYHQLQNLEMAKKQYDRARKINPTVPRSLEQLRDVNYSLKKYKRAVKDYESTEHQSRICDHPPQFGAAYFAMKKYEEDLPLMRKRFGWTQRFSTISTRGTIIRTAEVNQAFRIFIWPNCL